MPFISQKVINKERVDITEYEDPKDQLRGIELECRFCNTRMFIRKSAKGTFHFYHKRSCTSKYNSHPESPEHLAGKKFIANYITPKLVEYADFSPLYEEPLKEVNRIADLLVKFPMGWAWAHEVQLSPIDVYELDERTNDYLRNGVDVIWWFGKKANSFENREWSVKKYGFSPYLEFSEEQVVEYGYYSYKDYRGRDGLIRQRIGATKFNPLGESQESFEWPHLLPKLGHFWAKIAFGRYYQVWGKGNNDFFKRAFLANSATVKSFSGRVGAGNGTLFNKHQDLWFVNQEELPKYFEKQKIIPLPEEALTIIKNRAVEYNKK